MQSPLLSLLKQASAPDVILEVVLRADPRPHQLIVLMQNIDEKAPLCVWQTGSV